MTEPKDYQLSTRLPFGVHETLAAFALGEKRSKTAIITDALNAYFRANAIREYDGTTDRDACDASYSIYFTSFLSSTEYLKVEIYSDTFPNLNMRLTNVSKSQHEEARALLIQMMNAKFYEYITCKDTP